jgi:hypothetical protein
LFISGRAQLSRSSGVFLSLSQIGTEEVPRMFVFVAIDAEIFPVGAVGGVVEVVAVLVVHGQKMSVLMVKLSPAFRADEAVNLQRTLSVIAVRKSGFLEILDDFVERLLAPDLLHPGISPIITLVHRKGSVHLYSVCALLFEG